MSNFDPCVRILTDLENKNDNEKQNLLLTVTCTLTFYMFQTIYKRERIKGKTYRIFSTRMAPHRFFTLFSLANPWHFLLAMEANKLIANWLYLWELSAHMDNDSCWNCSKESRKRWLCELIRSQLHWWHSTHSFVASQQTRMNLLSLISLVICDGGNVCDHLYMVIQENLTSTVDTTKSEHPDMKKLLLKKLLTWANCSSEETPRLWWMCSLWVFSSVEEDLIVYIWHTPDTLHQISKEKNDSWGVIIS